MTKTKWEKVKRDEGTLYFKQHSTRKHGVKFDRYYRTEYQYNKKRIALNFGWASEGWTESACLQKLYYFKENAKAGKVPINFKQERSMKREQERQKKLEQKKIITFKNFFDKEYLPIAFQSKKENTVENEKGLFKNWLEEEVGHLPFSKIKPFNIEKIKKNLLDAERTPRTVQYTLAVFRQIWNQAKTNDIVKEDSPTRKVKIPRINNKRERFLTQEEADKLLHEIKFRSEKIYNMTLLSLHTGIRAKEVFTLTWGLVDFNNDSISIRDSKGGSRYVYMTNAIKGMLKELHQGQSNTELVFKDHNGKQIKKISKTFVRAVNNLGLNDNVIDRRDKVTFHTCRHTFASWHVQNGTDLYTVKELLGHSTIQLTERYSHLRPDGLKKAAQNFDRKVIQNDIVKLDKIKNA